MSVALILVGLPASGKSTFVRNVTDWRKLKGLPSLVVLSSDALIERRANDLGLSYSESFEINVKDAQAAISRELQLAITSGQDIIWDQTNLSIDKRRKIVSKLSKTHKMIAVIFEIDEVERRTRQLERTNKFIPDHVILRMRADYTKPEISEGFASVFLAEEVKMETIFRA